MVIALMVAIVTVAAINRHRLAGLGEPSIWALMRRCWRLLSVASLIGFGAVVAACATSHSAQLGIG